MIQPPETLEPWMHAVLMAAAGRALPNTEGLVTRDDLYQEGWLALGGVLAYYRASRGLTLEKWALVCLLRKMKTYVKEFRERRREVELPEELDPAETIRRSELTERREESDAVRALTRGLHPQSAELFRLRFVEGRPRPEIAKILGIHPMGVTKRISKLRPILQAKAALLTGAA